MRFLDKICSIFYDHGYDYPEIEKLEDLISMYSSIYLILNPKINIHPQKKIEKLQHLSDAERIRHGLKPKWYKYTKNEKILLLKEYSRYLNNHSFQR